MGLHPVVPSRSPPVVLRDVAAVKGTAAAGAAAAAQSEEAWLDEAVVVAAAAAQLLRWPQQQTALRKMSTESAMNIQMLRRRLPAM